MFENNDFDKAFGEQLSRTQEFHNAEKQWEDVYRRLSKKRRSNWIWLLPMLFTGVILLFGIYKINNNDLNEASVAEIMPLVVESVKQEPLSNIPILPIDNDDVTENRSSDDFSISENKIIVNKDPIVGKEKKSIRPTKYIDSLTAECNCDPNLEIINDLNEWNESDNMQSVSTPKESQYTNLQISTSTENGQPSLILETEHTSIKPNYKKLNPLELKKPNHLENRRSFMDIIPYSANQVSIVNQKNRSFGLEVGLFSQAIWRDSLVDNRDVGYAVGLVGQYKKVSMKIGFKRHKVDRVIKSNIGDYDITDMNFVYTTSSPDSIYLDYTNHLIDLSFGYEIFTSRGLTWNVLIGGQSRLIKEGNAKLVYRGAYEPIIGEGPIPSNGFEWSAVRLGSSFEVAIIRSMGIKAEYNLALPLSTKIVKWPIRHQFEFGIVYHLYRRQ